jgi:hypothetical protein
MFEIIPKARFSRDEAQAAAEAWGANCGPGALAAVLDKTLNDVRPFLGEFEKKGYMSPTMMYMALRALNILWLKGFESEPRNALWRVQWGGPWMNPGVPIKARYWHTHWIAARMIAGEIYIFDINAICAGGWITQKEWSLQLVPWMMSQDKSKWDGTLSFTHFLEVPRT